MELEAHGAVFLLDRLHAVPGDLHLQVLRSHGERDGLLLPLAEPGARQLDGRRILSPESVNTMVSEGHTPAKGGPAVYYQGLKHGLGWFIWPNGRRQGIMHNGDGPGFSTIMQLYPNERLGVIVLGNEWAYGTSLRGTSIRDSIAHLAASIDWH